MTRLISVVMPARNAESTIVRAIESVLSAQAPSSIELLVVDDGSTDSTLAIVKSLASADGRLVVLSANGIGANAARNVAIEYANGEWIALLDADDWWAPGRLPALIADAEAAGADLVADDVISVRREDQPGKSLFADRGIEIEGRTPLRLVDLVSRDLGTLQPIFERRLLKTGLRFPAWARQTGDFWFMLHLVNAAQAPVVVGRAGYYYRRHGTTLSSASPRMWAGSASVTADLLADPRLEVDTDVRVLLERRLEDAIANYHYLIAKGMGLGTMKGAREIMRHPRSVLTGARGLLGRRSR